MPLPSPNTPWPPTQLAQITPKLIEWDAWWTGDPEKLSDVYGAQKYGNSYASPSEQARHPNQYRGGVAGAVARFWWGKPQTDLTITDTRRLHLPVAGDLCQASADLLFADPPKIASTDKTTQDRITEYLEDGFLTEVARAAEVGAALGSTYLRVVWDESVSPRPFPSAVDADAAWPEFRHGRLRAVTFWWVVRTDGDRIWRHLERHEIDPQTGNGVILHALYQGNRTNLGQVIPLTEHDATAGLAEQLDGDQVIDTLSPGLAVEHIPNQQPQRRWRNDPVGRNLGRSDLDGVEGLMDALDESWSSWMRDIRLGKGRILAAESVLDDNGPGNGASFDTDRAVFSPLRVLQARDQTGLPIQAVQFAIRVTEHQQTTQALLEQVLRTAGYSQQTFGEGAAAGAMTATEVDSRDQRSLLTRDRKLRAWQPAVLSVLRKMLAIDQAVMSGGALNPDTVTIAFAEAVQESPLTLAQTAMALKSAEAASTKTLVRTVHPDWDDTQIDAEVNLIADQAPAPLADPFGARPTDGDQPPADDPAVDDATS